MTRTAIRSLDDLADALRNSPPGDSADYANERGLPVAHGEIDWTSLPTFGGDEPRDTAGVWSWDATRLLVGTCAADLQIVPRNVE